MPLYVFARVDQPRVTCDRLYSMNDAPSIGAVIVDEDGVSWRRIVTKPQASFDTKMDPYSAKDFVKVTNKPGRIGELWDRAAEASEVRAQKEGVDPIKEKFYEDYAKKRKGRRHPQQVREAGQKYLKSKGISVDYGDN